MLNLTLTTYALNGTYLGQQDVTTQLQLCPGDVRDLTRYQRIGSNYILNCRLDLMSIALSYPEPTFYELWLSDPTATDGSARASGPSLYPVPVIISNYRKSDGTTPNKFLADSPSLQLDTTYSGLGNIVPHRRFFLYDNIGGRKVPDPAKTSSTTQTQLQDMTVVRWASYMELRIQLRKDDPSTSIDESQKIYPPYLLIRYQQQVGSTISLSIPKLGASDESMRLPMVSFRATYCMDLSNFWYITMILFILLVIFMVISCGFKAFVHKQSLGIYPMQSEILFMDCCGTLADFFFWGLIVMCGYWFIFFKLQGVVKVLLPLDNPNSAFAAVFSICLVAKFAQVCMLIRHQSKVDIFFMDWEKPKEGKLRQVAKLQPSPTTNEEGQDVSVWRTIMIANEWAEMQSQRHTDIDFTLMFVLLFLVGLDYLYLSTPQPDVVDLSPGPTNAVLRFFVIAMWYFTVVVIQMVYRKFTYHFMDDPLDMFVDLCQLANISVFVLDGPIHGFYLHGRSVHPHADVNMHQLLANHKAETEGNLPFRGLTEQGDERLRGNTDLYFEMYLTESVRTGFDEKFPRDVIGVNARPVGRGPPLVGGRDAPNNAAASAADSALDVRAKAYNAVNEYLQKEVIEPIQARGDTDIRLPSWYHRLFGVPPPLVGQSTVFLRDNQQRFSHVLFYGIELELVILDLLMLAAWDLASGDAFVAALITYIISHGLCVLRERMGKENIARKTLIDPRFLI
mmetsp:Transcript_30753/g.82367  ORF Transcript_30753/g.82367 Transcript_30753/m.82367 type:complete len:735 (-) Transcript_30753:197-2401(-)